MARILIRLLTIVLVILVFLFVATSLFSVLDASWKSEYRNDNTSLTFPVLVVTCGRPQVVERLGLPRFVNEHPDYSFLVPLNKVNEYQAQIRADTDQNQDSVSREPESRKFWYAHFSVEQLTNGRQSFEVEANCSDDYANTGWYEATEKEVFPISSKFYFGPGLAMILFPVAVVVTALIFVMVMSTYKLLAQNLREIEGIFPAD